jgi:hypothetical protein
MTTDKPGQGAARPLPPIPRGIEVLVAKAAVDPEFRRLLLERRGEAAREIGLALDPAEAAMLTATPKTQLETIIAQTTVSPSLRPAFLGRAAAVMLAALGAGVLASCAKEEPPPAGKNKAADRPAAVQPTKPEAKEVADAPAKKLAKPPEKSPEEPKPVMKDPTGSETAISEDDAAAIHNRIIEEYLASFTALAAQHGLTGRTVRVHLWLDSSGAVTCIKFANPEDAGPPDFRGLLCNQAMKWKLTDLHGASTATAILKTPRSLPSAEGEPVPEMVEVTGKRDGPPPPPVIVPGTVTVVPGIVAAQPTDKPLPPLPPTKTVDRPGVFRTPDGRIIIQGRFISGSGILIGPGQEVSDPDGP